MKAALRIRNWRTARLTLLGALILLIGRAAPAHAVAIDIANSIPGTVGDTLDVAVSTDDLTGLGVYSYEFDLTFTSSRATLIDVVEVGTLSSVWGPPVFGIGVSAVHVAAAGNTPLTGSGTLVFLRFVLGPSSGTSSLNFTDFVFNEGDPPATTSNGWISVGALPTITVSPNSGEILVGDMLSFSASGGTAPYTWGVTEPGVAFITTAGGLTALAPGATRVFAEDTNAVRDTTNAEILVRAMAVSAPSISAAPGAVFTLSISVTDLTGLDIHGFDFDLDWSTGRFDVLSADFTGTVASAWGTPVIGTDDGHVTVAGAGDAPLNGAGTLVNLECMVLPTSTSSTSLVVSNGLFDERYLPLHVNGTFLTDLPGVIAVSPNTGKVLVGDTLQFTASGSVTPPLTWSTTDVAVATIDAAGLLTPVVGGDVRVFAVDGAGARDTSSVIQVFDLGISIPNQVVQSPLTSTAVRVEVDRDVTPLAIYGYEFTVRFDDADVVAIAATDSGSVTSAWGPPVYHIWPDSIRVSHGGSTPAAGGPGPLVHLYFEPAPGAMNGATSFANFTMLVLNEGVPRACLGNGTLTVDDTITGAPVTPGLLSLSQNRPNPFTDVTTIQFSVRREMPTDLALTIVNPSGRIVRRFDLKNRASGVYHVRWDGRNGQGARVGSGVYFYRLSGGGEENVRKAILLR